MSRFTYQIIKLFLSLIPGLGIIGCETIIEVELPSQEPELVLNSYFGTDTTFIVTLHESKGILDASHDFKVVQGATIQLYAENQLIGTFTESSVTPEYGNEWEYYALDHYPEAGVNYSIVASRSGFKAVEAQDAIPLEKTNPSVENFKDVSDGEYYGDRKYQLTYSFNDPPGEDFYEVFLYAEMPEYEFYRDADTSYYSLIGYRKNRIYYEEIGAELNEFQDNSVDPTLFSDELFDGRKYTHTIEAYIYFHSQNKDNTIKLYFEVKHVSEAYFRYKKSFKLQLDSDGNPFAEPAPVYNNVEGGLGIFAGYGIETIYFEYDR
ncbi:MAG: DUF4249 domain-containing protein [Bacteroidota bacterium]